VLFPRQEPSGTNPGGSLSCPQASATPLLYFAAALHRVTQNYTIADNFIDISFSMSYSLTNLTLSPQEA
jgi:hypothetical protein